MSRADIVTGNNQYVCATDLTPADWGEILACARSELSVGCLRGLKSIRQILETGDHLGATTGSPPQVIKNDAERRGLLKDLKHNATFLQCSQLLGLPSIKEWPREQRTVTVPGYDYTDSFPVPCTTWYLLFDREQFCLLSAEWNLEEVPRNEKASLMDRKPRFIAVARILQLIPTNIPYVITSFPEKKIGLAVLATFHRVQDTTVLDMKSRYREAERKKENLFRYMRRVGY